MASLTITQARVGIQVRTQAAYATRTSLEEARTRIIEEGRRKYNLEEGQKLIGQIVKVQFGNAGDFGWTEEKNCDVPCKVLAVEPGWLGTSAIFLVQKVDDAEYVGAAQLVNDSTHMRCTIGMQFGSKASRHTGILDIVDACNSLGFHAYAESLLGTHEE